MRTKHKWLPPLYNRSPLYNKCSSIDGTPSKLGCSNNRLSYTYITLTKSRLYKRYQGGDTMLVFNTLHRTSIHYTTEIYIFPEHTGLIRPTPLSFFWRMHIFMSRTQDTLSILRHKRGFFHIIWNVTNNSYDKHYTNAINQFLVIFHYESKNTVSYFVIIDKKPFLSH